MNSTFVIHEFVDSRVQSNKINANGEIYYDLISSTVMFALTSLQHECALCHLTV